MNLQPSPRNPQRAFRAEDARIVSGASNRVLRNTYALLALSMVPTVAGAWIGLATGLGTMLGGLFGMILFLVVAFGLIGAIGRYANTRAAVPLLLGFTFFMGLMLSGLLGVVLGMHHGSGLVMLAFAGTASIFLGMATLSSVIKRDLSAMGKWLFVGVVMLMVAGIANVFLHSGALLVTMATLAVGIFSAFILHDLKRVRDGQETNYVLATLGVYLSVFNVFQNLLALLGILGGGDD